MATPKLHFGAAFNEGYMPVVKQYSFLEGFEKLVGIEKFVMVIDGREEFVKELQEKYPTIRFVSKPKYCFRVQKQMAVVPSPQYGAFIDEVPWITNEEDYVVFIDCDLTVQRQIKQEEIDKLLIDVDRVYVTMNARGNHTMIEELAVLKPNADIAAFKKEFGDIDKSWCYNCGVLGMSVRQWRIFIDLFEANFDKWSAMVTHHGSNQFFMCTILNNMNFKMHDPWSDFVKDFHAHCHEATSIKFFGLSRRKEDGLIVRNNEPVLLAHVHYHPAWQHLL